jgi:hypothetical protein
MENLTEKPKENSTDRLKKAIKEFLDKYYIYQELEHKLKFLDDSVYKPDIIKQKDHARSEWKKASEAYQLLLLSKNKSLS